MLLHIKSGRKRSEPALNCVEARQEISAYLNRDLEGERHQAMEYHLVGCGPCLDEAEFMQMMVAGLRGMPVVKPPIDFVERTVSRWASQGCGCIAEPSLTSAPPFPVIVAGALVRLQQVNPHQMTASPLPHAPSRPTPRPPQAPPIAPAGRPSWLSRSYRGLGVALVAVFLVCGLFTSLRIPGARLEEAAFAGRLLSTPLDQIATRALPVSVDVAGGSPGTACQGRTGEWNAACLKMTSPRPLRVCEMHMPVPAGLEVEFQQSRYEPLQLAALSASREDDGHWQGHMRWLAPRSGQFGTFIEIRSDGVYRRIPLTFVARR